MAEHFWGEVSWASAEAFGLIIVGLFAEAEICQFDVSIAIEEDVLGFEVAIDDVLFVEVLDGKAQLRDIEFGLILREGDLSGEVEAEVSAGTVVQCEIEVMGCLECEVQVDDELVICLL